MKPSKPYEEVQITPTLIWRWVREGDEYVMRISEMALEAHKAHIEAALAQPEQEPFKPDWVSYRQGVADGAAQPEQEPVDIHCPSCLHSFSIVPVAKREWVGLTDDEVDACFEDHGWSSSAMYYLVANALEFKLKEKNGG